MTKLKANRIQNLATISVPLDQCLNCGEQIYQIQDTRNNVNSPKLPTAVVAFDSFVQNSRTQVFMRDALKEVYGLLYLVQLNQDSDGCALCVDCCLVFAQLYGLFHTFESRRKSDGFLGSTLKLAFKSVAAGSSIVACGAAEEVDNNELMGAGQATMGTDPSDSFIVIQGISSEENSDAEDDNDDQDVDITQNFDAPPNPYPDPEQDVEISQNIGDGWVSTAKLEPASPVNSGPASPVDNDPASPVQSEPNPEELYPLESPSPSPPVPQGWSNAHYLEPMSCPSNAQVRCKFEECPRFFATKKAMHSHHNSAHEKAKCATCGRDFSAHYISKHRTTCQKKNFNICKLCQHPSKNAKENFEHTDKHEVLCSCNPTKVIKWKQRRQRHAACRSYTVVTPPLPQP